MEEEEEDISSSEAEEDEEEETIVEEVDGTGGEEAEASEVIGGGRHFVWESLRGLTVRAAALVGALVARLARAVQVSETSVGVVAVFLSGLLPCAMTMLMLYPLYRLVFGTLYPAYASYKAVRTKNVKEYVKWMMYWIVFALFTCAETFTDVFLSFWFPFYYEIKIILVLWLLSPATKGSSILYRKFVHPMLSRREQEIDEYIAKAKEQGYTTVLHLGTKGVNYATSVIMQTAIKNLSLPSSVSSHSLLPVSGGRVRTSSAPGDETDMLEDEEITMARRRSRSLADARALKRGVQSDKEVPSSDVNELVDHSFKSEPIPVVEVQMKNGRTKKTRKTRTSATRATKQIDVSDIE